MLSELPLNELHGVAMRLDRAGVVVAANLLFQRLAGDENAGSSGQLWPDLASPEFAETALGRGIAEALRGKLFGELESNLQAPSGELLSRHWFGTPTHDASGVMDGAMVVGEEWGAPPDQKSFHPDKTAGLDDAAWAMAMYWELRRRTVPLLGYADLLRCETAVPEDECQFVKMSHQAAGRIAAMLNSSAARVLTPDGADGKANERLQLLGGIATDINNGLTILAGFAQLLLDGVKAPVTARPITEKLLDASDWMVVLLRLVITQLRERCQTAH